MLTGINTPGRPLDAVSYVKFHLAKSRFDEGQKDVAKLDSSTPNSAVFVAACAILENVKTAVMTDELSIVTEALAVSKNRIDSIRIFEDFDNGLNYEETYWTRAIPVAQYLEQMDDSSINPVDRCIMPLLALSRIKPSKTSPFSKTLRLVQPLLVAAILSFGGKVALSGSPPKDTLSSTNDVSLRSYFESLGPHLLSILVTNNNRVTALLEFIEKQLNWFKKGERESAQKGLNLKPEKIDQLLKILFDSTTSPKVLKDMMGAGIKFAVLLACQPPKESKWRFDGLHDFQLEHIAAQKSSTEISDSLIHRLGNYCMLEPEKNSSAGNKPFSDKKLVYKDSAFYAPWELSQRDDLKNFLEPQIRKRHKELLNKLYYLLKPKGSDPPGKTFDLPLNGDHDSPENGDHDLRTEKVKKILSDEKGHLNDDSCRFLEYTFKRGCTNEFESVTREQFEAVFCVCKYFYKPKDKDKKQIFQSKKMLASDKKEVTLKHLKGTGATSINQKVIQKDTFIEWRTIAKQLFDEHNTGGGGGATDVAGGEAVESAASSAPAPSASSTGDAGGGADDGAGVCFDSDGVAPAPLPAPSAAPLSALTFTPPQLPLSTAPSAPTPSTAPPVTTSTGAGDGAGVAVAASSNSKKRKRVADNDASAPTTSRSTAPPPTPSAAPPVISPNPSAGSGAGKCPRNPKCGHCHKTGHYKKTCPSKK
jgi:hypothetical protein